jgi:broad specificity phosphatase PhoE
MNLVLVRHGETLSNIDRVYAGMSSESLTDVGRGQAEAVASKLKSRAVDALYSSPIRRASETARIIAKTICLDMNLNGAFKEMRLGPWEGMSEDAIAASYPGEWELWQTRPAELKMPGRETLEELRERVFAGLRGIKKEMAQGNIVIVTHVAIIRVLLLWRHNRSLNLYKTISVPNAGMFEICVDTLL